MFISAMRHSGLRENECKKKKVYKTEESSSDGLPEPVSSSYGQTRAESPPQHPTGDCGPGTAGCLYRDPETER